jgi:AbrB family looped-hinge helix DNA binding protein
MFGIAEEVKVGVKSQIVIPARIRDDLKIFPGDMLIIATNRNGSISLIKKQKDWAKAAFGCCKGVWGDKPLDYVQEERDSWTR